MTRNEIMLFLTNHKQEMREQYGVEHIGLFGSYARETAREDSDIDIVVEFLEDKNTLRNFFGFKRYLEGRFGKTVDLGIESTLKPMVREAVRQDILYA